MPRKTKRKSSVVHSLKLTRKAKRSRAMYGENSRVCVNKENEFEELLSTTDALDTDNEETDPCFELESSMMLDTDYIAETFCEDWVSHLSRDDCVSLSLVLCFQLTRHLGFAETKAAELAGMMVGKCDKSVREWKKV